MNETAILVQIFGCTGHTVDDLDEFRLLAESAQLEVCQVVTVNRQTPHIKYYVGSGKILEIADLANSLAARVIIFNCTLTPAQIRNIQNLCENSRIIDRTILILDIFAQRARSYEGKLQVELAQLKYLATRLIGRKTGLDQQKGAVGLRGPGETQLETDRRLIKLRIKQLQNRLENVHRQREQNRRARQKSAVPTISLVGYTNAGKSTLFNQLTSADVYAADQLFATLDPTLRKLIIPHIGDVIIADTVGFIRDLPHDLISAFRATLQETCEADLLLHIIDVADERYQENEQSVLEVLTEIKANTIPTLLIYNKIDQTTFAPTIKYDENNRPFAVYLSAKQNQGLDLLFTAIQQKLATQITQLSLTIPAQYAYLRYTLYQKSAIKSEHINEQGEG